MAVEQAIDSRTLEELCINTIRVLSIDAVQHADSGHPGMPMGAAAMAYTLWDKYLRFNPKDPLWADRDRFVLSAGHGSMLLYSLLHLTGYDLPLEQLKQFRQWGSHTPGHPERGEAPGVEVSTGPLGQGFGNGVGMAIAEAWLAARFNKPGHEVINHHTYGIVSDGDLMEGVASEAASLAGHLKLGKLVYLYDYNHISLAGATNLSYTEDVQKRFDAYGWHTQLIHAGNDTEAIARAIEAAKAETERPSLILVRTHIGFGSPKKQDTFGAHGSPLGEDEVKATKKALGWPTEDYFYLPEEAVEHFRQAVPRGAKHQSDWQARIDAYAQAFPGEAAELQQFLKGELPADYAADLPKWQPTDKPVATRVASGQALNALAKRVHNIVGGSADLNPSTNTAMKEMGDFQPTGEYGAGTPGAVGGDWSYAGRNLHFGVREHAMGAIVNGMAAHGGVIPFSATFLVFSDYMKPSVRLGAIMGLHSIYVFTHDSIAVGEDGPTHEPVEHLAGLRAIPHLTVIRPADANEAAETWVYAVSTNKPTLMAMSRQNLPVLDRSKAVEPGIRRGAYVLSDGDGGAAQVILIGTGSEVSLCVKAQEKLKEFGVSARVVSMPSTNLFDAQDEAYRESVLPKALRKRVTVEAGCSFGWHKYAGDEGTIIGLDRFGASAKGEENLKKFGFTGEHVTAAALRLLGKNAEADQVDGGGDTSMAPTAPQEGHS